MTHPARAAGQPYKITNLYQSSSFAPFTLFHPFPYFDWHGFEVAVVVVGWLLASSCFRPQVAYFSNFNVQRAGQKWHHFGDKLNALAMPCTLLPDCRIGEVEQTLPDTTFAALIGLNFKWIILTCIEHLKTRLM